jgi:predicted nucleic acid-binding protein
VTSTPPRVVVDPGVLIAGFISTGGTTARLLDAVLSGRAIAVVSPRLVRELRTVLLRDKVPTVRQCC